MPRTKDKFSEQKKTLKAVRDILNQYNKCMLVRPTGFGKTFLLTELINDSQYKHVLYLYPSAVIGNTVVNRYYELNEENAVDPETVDLYNTLKDSNQISKCDLMTYNKLVRHTPKQLTNLARKYDLIICDEAHRLGGYRTKLAMEHLFAKAKKTTHFIGATATPTRMDNFDVSSHFFGDHMPYIYTLFDAIESGLLQKPNYCFATYNIANNIGEDLKKAYKDNGEDVNDPMINDIINARAIEAAKLFNMPTIIKDVCDKYALDTNYMKFIIFFAGITHMNKKIDEVKEWFQTAYPKYKINVLKISSHNEREQNNTAKLATLKPQNKTIDLIACVDMLNVGYHVSDQTGILMYRGTKSNIVFTQQLGRALSAGANNSAIVFDIVDNLHQPGVFEVYAKPNNYRPRSKKIKSAGNKALLDNYILDPNSNNILAIDKDGNTVETQYHLNKRTNKILDKNNNPSTFVYDKATKTITNTATVDDPAKNINMISPEFLNATGHEATYKEIIAKAMAEPLVQRCKYTLQLHFRSWCVANGVPYPISDEELNRIYGLDIQDFYDEFRKIIRANKLKYPLNDAEKLLKMGSDKNSTDIPMDICCKARNISIEQLTDIIFSTVKTRKPHTKIVDSAKKTAVKKTSSKSSRTVKSRS